MFDWSDQDQVGEPVWDELNETEDHIVPYPKDTDGHLVFTSEDCSKKQKNNDTNAIARSTGQSSGRKSGFRGCFVENSSSFNANEGRSGSRLDMDNWPDLPTLNSELSTRELSSLNKSFSSLAGGTMKLDSESEFFQSACEDKEDDSFLSCDWANVGDLDDLEMIFRNESIFGHDMVPSMDEFLSSSADTIGITVLSTHLPDIPVSRNQPSDQGFSSFQLVEHSGGKRKAENHQTADVEQAFCQTSRTNQLTENDDQRKKLLKLCKKDEEGSKNKASQLHSDLWSQNVSQNQTFQGQNVCSFGTNPSQIISSPQVAQKRQVDDAELVENTGPSWFMHPQYGCAAYRFPGIPLLQHVQPDTRESNAAPVGHSLYSDSLRCLHPSSVVLEAQSKPLAMTPQEKMEKLRRRQQAQAMLAIQKQQQQFGQQMNGAENTIPPVNFQRNKVQAASNTGIEIKDDKNKLPSLGLNSLLQHDSSVSTFAWTDNCSLEKTIYYQLQYALRKLDTKVRLCIRDSLFRLGRSSMERQNASDRSHTNKSKRDDCDVPINEESSSGKRLPDAETYTNPVDRAVAHLLFHRPLESCAIPINHEMPESPVLYNPVSKLHPNIHGSTSKGEPESLGEMDLHPPESS